MAAITSLNFESEIAGLTLKQASLWGFRSGDRGTHTSRTIMLDELSQLMGAVPGEVSRQEYVDAIARDNCLGKRTAATRQNSLQRLTELYGLDGRLLLFRAVRVGLTRFGGRLRAVATSTEVGDSLWKGISLGDRS